MGIKNIKFNLNHYGNIALKNQIMNVYNFIKNANQINNRIFYIIIIFFLLHVPSPNHEY